MAPSGVIFESEKKKKTILYLLKIWLCFLHVINKLNVKKKIHELCMVSVES